MEKVDFNKIGRYLDRSLKSCTYFEAIGFVESYKQYLLTELEELPDE